jgi:hypothetical protein
MPTLSPAASDSGHLQASSPPMNGVAPSDHSSPPFLSLDLNLTYKNTPVCAASARAALFWPCTPWATAVARDGRVSLTFSLLVLYKFRIQLFPHCPHHLSLCGRRPPLLYFPTSSSGSSYFGEPASVLSTHLSAFLQLSIYQY